MILGYFFMGIGIVMIAGGIVTASETDNADWLNVFILGWVVFICGMFANLLDVDKNPTWRKGEHKILD